MTAVMWLDNNAVHFLSNGAVCAESTVKRTPKHGGAKEHVQGLLGPLQEEGRKIQRDKLVLHPM
jgi:hypothetical protein